MQAIITKCLHATNHKPTRYKASCRAGSVTIVATSVSEAACHEAARLALCTRLEARIGADEGGALWLRPMATGQLASGEYVHVYLDKAYS